MLQSINIFLDSRIGKYWSFIIDSIRIDGAIADVLPLWKECIWPILGTADRTVASGIGKYW